MKKRLNRRNRRQRVIIAYTARVVCALVLILMLILMGCGCLYIYEHLNPKESENPPKIENNDDSNNEKNQPDAPVTDNDPEKTPSDGGSIDVSGNSLTPISSLDASGLTIVLDAGHGGKDGGTVGKIGSDEIIEKDINLSVVQKMQSLLEECGATVILTRESDEFPSLEDRNYIANQTAANLFVSIHCNAFEDDASVSGLECYYHKKSDVSKQYAEEIYTALDNLDTLKVRYAMHGNYQVLRNSSLPAILIEMGYLTNTTDCQNLSSSKFQDTLAQALVIAIVETLNQ